LLHIGCAPQGYAVALIKGYEHHTQRACSLRLREAMSVKRIRHRALGDEAGLRPISGLGGFDGFGSLG